MGGDVKKKKQTLLREQMHTRAASNTAKEFPDKRKKDKKNERETSKSAV